MSRRIIIMRFLGLFLGCLRLTVWGRGKSLNARQKQLVDEVQLWTSRFFAPALMKPLDALVADQLLSNHNWNGPVLDAGCGACRFGYSIFKPWLDKVTIDGLDLEIEMESNIDSGHRDMLRNFYKMSFEDTGLRDNTYGLIFSNNALQAAPVLEDAIKEFHRIMVKDGLLIFNVTTPAYQRRLRPDWEMLPRYFTVNEIKDTVVSCGFEALEITPYNSGFFAKMDFRYFMPAYKDLWAYEVNSSIQPHGALYQLLFGWFRKFLSCFSTAYVRALREQGAGDSGKLYVVARKR